MSILQSINAAHRNASTGNLTDAAATAAVGAGDASSGSGAISHRTQSATALSTLRGWNAPSLSRNNSYASAVSYVSTASASPAAPAAAPPASETSPYLPSAAVSGNSTSNSTIAQPATVAVEQTNDTNNSKSAAVTSSAAEVETTATHAATSKTDNKLPPVPSGVSRNSSNESNAAASTASCAAVPAPAPAPKPAPWRSSRLSALLAADAAAAGKPPVPDLSLNGSPPAGNTASADSVSSNAAAATTAAATFSLGRQGSKTPAIGATAAHSSAPPPGSYAAAVLKSRGLDSRTSGSSETFVAAVASAPAIEETPEPDARKLKTAKRIELVPIDHGLCLPSINALDEVTLTWINWRQARQPLSPANVAYVLSLNDRADALMLRSVLGERLRPSCLLTLRVCTVLLQEGVRAGLTLAEIGKMMTRGTGVGLVDPSSAAAGGLLQPCPDHAGPCSCAAIAANNGVIGGAQRRCKKYRNGLTPKYHCCDVTCFTSGSCSSGANDGSGSGGDRREERLSALEQAVRRAKKLATRSRRHEKKGASSDDRDEETSAGADVAIDAGLVAPGTLAFLPYHDAVVRHFRGVIGAHIAATLRQREQSSASG